MRNPVTSASKLTASDILDWFYAEFGLQFTPDSLMTFGTFQKCSKRCLSRTSMYARLLLLIGGRLACGTGAGIQVISCV